MKSIKNKNQRLYENIKTWLFDQDLVSIESIENEFGFGIKRAKIFFRKLEKQKLIYKISPNQNDWMTSQFHLVEDKKGTNWPNSLAKASKSFIRYVEKKEKLKVLSMLPFSKGSPYENLVHPDKPIQVLDPVDAFIFSCKMKRTTFLLSDDLTEIEFFIHFVSRLSGLSIKKVLSQKYSNSEMRSLILATAEIASWPGHIEILNNDGLKGSRLVELCKSPRYETLILNIDSKYIKATDILSEIAKQNKKIIVFPKLSASIVGHKQQMGGITKQR